jgi:Protein of unknown function (DUF2783)
MTITRDPAHRLQLTPQWSDADGFYEQLLDAHANLSPAQSQALNARLILLLANQIGHAQVLAQCIALAQHEQQSSNL